MLLQAAKVQQIFTFYLQLKLYLNVMSAIIYFYIYNYNYDNCMMISRKV